MTVSLTVNGKRQRLEVARDTPLIYVLRNDLGLKGAKFACGLGQCGACNVLVDSRAVPACHLEVGDLRDSEITTIEGIGSADDLHPIQAAFIEEQAIQCGYCVPGLIVTAKALLDEDPEPSEKKIRRRLGLNLCRCGVYDRVLRATQRAAGHAVDSAEDRTVVTGLSTVADAAQPTDPTAGSLKQTPGIDDWIRINQDGTVTVFTGKVELGQDLRTSFAMIAAEELDVALARIRVVMEDTALTPNEGFTGSSLSMETSGNAIRNAAAEARHWLVTMVSESINVPFEYLSVEDGTITDSVSGQSVTYFDFFGGKRFERDVAGLGRLKASTAYRIVASRAERLDSVAKVTGAMTFAQDLEFPDMLHGRVVRPPDNHARLLTVDTDAAAAHPGVVEVVRDGSFLAVLAVREEQAVQAAELLRRSATWQRASRLPTHESLVDYMRSQPDQAFLVVDGTPTDDPIPPIVVPDGASQTLRASYSRPYLMHAATGPSAAAAIFEGGRLDVWSHAQGVYGLRRELARVLGIETDAIHVAHVDSPGSFGHNGANDVALDAALLARAVPGRHVAVRWSRNDEHRFEPYGAPSIIDLEASLDDEGQLLDWNHDVRGYTHINFSGPGDDRSPLMPSWHLENPMGRFEPFPVKTFMGGIHRNANPIYAFPNPRIVKHFLPDSPLRVSSLRGLGSYANVFAIESFVDELAHAAGTCAVAFRRRYLHNGRARAVLDAVLEKAGWEHGDCSLDGDDRGWGVALSQYKNLQCYTATFVVVAVDRRTGKVTIERAVLAADVGQIVNPESIRNQLEGSFTMSASWTLREEVTFDAGGVTSVDWRTYPIFRLGDTPRFETVVIDRPGEPYLGLGEGAMGPIPAAIANAVFRAVGVRFRRLPLTPTRVKDSL